MAKYSKKLVAIITELIEEDISVTDICRTVGITRKTFYEWKTTKSEFAQAIEDARERSYEQLITMARQALRQRIEGHTSIETIYTYEPDPIDEGKMILKKKVVKQKQKHPSIASLNTLIKKTERKTISNNIIAPKNERKKIVLTPSNSHEASILAQFYAKMESDNKAYQNNQLKIV